MPELPRNHGYPKRLIEVDLPIKKISVHARREKSIRHGHISTLHIWWARRPLAACRAVLCAALWPDPADPLCPQMFRDDACRLVNEFAAKAASDKALSQKCSHETWKKWQALAKTGGLDGSKEPHWNVLRFALLDFIADFADWDNSSGTEYLDTARGLTQSAHESLGGIPGTRSLVVDPFAGGGSIPLEALRVGADAFASDLNPVAVLLNKVVLEYIPKHGQRLAEEVRKWGEWVSQRAGKELQDLYLGSGDGSAPMAYIWARTIRCEGPGCGATIPLVRSLWLAKKSGPRSAALRIVPDPDTKRIGFVIEQPAHETRAGTVRLGSATCPICGYTTPKNAVREQLRQRRGGSDDAQLIAVVDTRREAGRCYRLPSDADVEAAKSARTRLRALLDQTDGLCPVPNEPVPQERVWKNNPVRVHLYGMTRWGDLFTSRQALGLATLVRLVREVADQIDGELSTAVNACLSLAVSRCADKCATLVVWNNLRENVDHVFGRQALPMMWDFAEANLLSDVGWDGAYGWVVKVVEANTEARLSVGHAERASADAHPLPNDSCGAFVTDPPYYEAVPYATLSDFFYVWLKRCLPPALMKDFGDSLVDKTDEIVVDDAKNKDHEFYESRMTQALAEGRRVLTHAGIGVVVFAHKSTSGWEAMLQAMLDAGWVITASWPIDTEREGRLRAIDSAALASSVHLVCRAREESENGEVGDWRDVLADLPTRIHEWMPRLAGEGVVGADAIFACLGPALEIFSRYSRVEKPDGEQVTLKEYLEYVWAAVSKEAISMIFEGADTTGFEEDARLTAMWLWTLNPGPSNGEPAEPGETEENDEDSDEKPAKSGKTSGFTLEYDAARKIAQGLGAHLEQLVNLVEVKGETARLLPVSERNKALFGKEGTESPAAKRKKSPQLSLPGLLEELEGEEGGLTLQNAAKPGETTLDRLHQAMILFAAGRGEALRRFLVEDGAGKDQRFWRLAQSLCALYPSGTDERRWAEGVLARKKGLGL